MVSVDALRAPQTIITPGSILGEQINPTKTIPFKLYTSVTHPLLADSSLNNAIDTNGD